MYSTIKFLNVNEMMTEHFKTSLIEKTCLVQIPIVLYTVNECTVPQHYDVPLSVHFFCSCHKVFIKQEVSILLYLLG